MFLKQISFDESFNYSPWPARLLGFEKWQKTKRGTQEILDEYNNGWYKNALSIWQNNYKNSSNPLAFFADIDNEVLKTTINAPDIYGVYDDQHLVSIQKKLYLANWAAVSSLYESLLQKVLWFYVDKFNIETIVELGCGTGVNLFKFFYKNSIKKIIGGDICSNAVELGSTIARQCSIEADFKVFDYFDDGSINKIVSKIDEPYIIFTSHSIEQIQVGQTSLIDQILNLKKKPEVVVHFEPALNLENSEFFSKLCKLYAEKNLYNLDLLQELNKHKQNNDIEILDYQEDVIGINISYLLEDIVIYQVKQVLRPFWHHLLSVFKYINSFWFFRYIQYLWYGNTVSPLTNRGCMKNWKMARKESNFPPSELHKYFVKEGYVSLGQILNLEDLSNLQEEFKSAINSNELSESPYDDPIIRQAYNYKQFSGDVAKFRRDIKDCQKSLPTVEKILNDSSFQSLIQEVIGCKHYELSQPNIAAWRNYHVPQNISNEFEVITNRFHFDNQLVDRFKIFIYLSDVTIDDGPFQHFPKSYSRALLLRGFQESKRKLSITGGLSPSVLNSPKLIKHVGKSGHVLVCATSFCLHRAGEPALGHWRDLLQVSIRPKQLK